MRVALAPVIRCLSESDAKSQLKPRGGAGRERKDELEDRAVQVFSFWRGFADL